MDPKQAEQLCVEAVNIISRESTESENRRAVELFAQVAEAGYSQGMFGLAEMKMAGKGTEMDVAGAIELYTQAGAMGNLPALFRLGNICWEPGEYNNPGKAFECFKQCSDVGFTPAYNCLGDCFIYGIGVAKDPAKAVEWFQKAADERDAGAMFKLACLYEGEMGVPKDENKANKMYFQAATAGVPEAQFHLANLAYDGKIEGGKKLAAAWYARCAEEIPLAKFNLATLYYSGDGIDKDLKKAFELYHQLAHAGDADAMYQVGKMYIGGEGVEADAEAGFKHIGMAAQAGNEEAAVLIETLRRRQNTQFIKIDGTE
ncbi:MAG: sel1 repeat family protein [archaeon]|nr:sel1 repeat family protein [archaeon]